MNEGQALWTRFWSGLGARQGGCLPNAPDVHAAVSAVWSELARSLPSRARVLDIGTGNGAVLLQLRQVRRDLQLIGVDGASKLPSTSSGIKLKPNVVAERLPFGDRSFDAATSQFAYEYTDTAKTGAEIYRVLAPGGRLTMIVHDRNSTLAKDNRERAGALRWFRDSGLIGKAEALARARRTIGLPTPPEFARKVMEARATFPDLETAEQLAYWVLETLELGRTNGPEATLASLAQIDSLTAEELGLLQELDRAGLDEKQAREAVQALREIGFAVGDPQQLTTPRGPLAWRIAGAKAAQ